MVMTSDLARHDLARIEALLAALGASYPDDIEELDDFIFLQEQRTFLLALLASRLQQRRQKIVRLDRWREGSFTAAPQSRSRAA